MPMNPELKAKWVEALRSGKYKQGRSFLHTVDDKFCCLGVLAEVAELPSKIAKDNENCYRYVFLGSGGEVESASFLYGDLLSELQDKEMILVNMNDSKNKTFDEIADYIEEHL